MKIVEFKIVSKEDSRIYLNGNFDIDSYNEDSDMGDWEYEQNDGSFATHLPNYWKVDGENLSFEFEQFIDSINWDMFRQWLFDCYNENRSVDFGDYILCINEGAKMECEIKESEFGEYIAEVIPKFNCEKVNLVEYMTAIGEEFDPYDSNEEGSFIENGHIYFEISKDFEDEKEANMELINEEARRIFARSLTYNLSIYAKYGDVMEQALDDTYDNEWLFKLSSVSDDDLDGFLREEGFIDEMVG